MKKIYVSSVGMIVFILLASASIIYFLHTDNANTTQKFENCVNKAKEICSANNYNYSGIIRESPQVALCERNGVRVGKAFELVC